MITPKATKEYITQQLFISSSQEGKKLSVNRTAKGNPLLTLG